MKYVELSKNEILSKIKNGTIPIEEGISLLKCKKKVESEKVQKTDIAVVGISARVPGAKNIDEFWGNLKNGVDAVKETPKNRWNTVKNDMGNNKERPICNWSGLLEDYDKFDPLFFNISPLEAEVMDPQQRLFLEESWKAIEDAGINPESLSGSNCGVFVGVAQGDYSQNLRHNKDRLDAQSLNGGQNSILSSRISYYLNLVGPNVAIDTACSSSLVATHMAYQSIVNNECEMALAGGINILSTADMNLMTSNGKMLSKDGKCKAFDEDADGFVLSEAVAVVVLMPLEKALNENYSIYGVIKGSRINQDGKTNGITAPSSKSQTSLELDVYKKSNINPEKISYVEAHGTGTKLGDPIEISALTNAFQEYTNRTNYCAIGSSKTNIGHSLTVAGTIGLIKILLCMKYKKLVPSLHFHQLNQHIHLKESPFYVNTEYKDWKVENGEKRLAAISSFGLSGTNCHMVIEEEPVDDRDCSDYEQNEYLFTISSKTKDSLKTMIRQLVDWLKREENKYQLKDISYTLNVGRTHFEYRVAVIANNRGQLIEQLSEFLTDRNYFDNIMENEEHSKNKELSGKSTDIGLRDIQETKTLEKYIVNFEEIKNQYLEGTSIPWNHYYEKQNCRRISLPTYAFLKERYWASGIDDGNVQTKLVPIHPLITSNQSTLKNTKFQLLLTGNESVINDHYIQGQKVFPGAAYIEMVRAAATIAGEKRVCGIKNITWLSQIKPQHYPIDVFIDLYRKNDEVEFDVCTIGEENEKTIHAIGKVMYEADVEDIAVGINLDQVKSRCFEEIDDIEAYYKLFESTLVLYGDSFRTLKKVWRKDGEVLARLELMKEYHKEAEGFVIYPGLLDGALQSAVALGSLIDEQKGTCNIPFKVENITIYDTIPTECYALTKFSDDSDIDSSVKKYDISILNNEGTRVVDLKGVLSRPIKNENKTLVINNCKDIIAFKGVWKEIKQLDAMEMEKDILVFDTNKTMYLQLKQTMGVSHNCYLIMPGKEFQEIDEQIYEINPSREEDYNALRVSLLKKTIKSIHVINLWYYRKDYIDLDTPVESGLFQMYYFTKAFMYHSNSNKVIVSNIVLQNKNGSCAKWNAINGYGKSVRLELPNVLVKAVMVDQYTNLNLVVENEINLTCDGVFEICYVNNKQQAKVLEEIEIEKQEDYDRTIKHNYVYVISGGAGGLGLLFAEYITSKAKATIILLGRSELSEEKKSRIQMMESKGSSIEYYQVDITNKEKLNIILNTVRSKYGSINGIIHSAGVIKDALLIRKTEDMLQCVVQPKVNGVIHLDELTKDDNLDFFVCFSAIASVFGNVGQCDYSYANDFLDCYMEERKVLVEQRKRKGISISINWPLWEEGGMNIGGDTRKKLLQRLGMLELNPSEGFRFFEYVLNTQGGQFMIMAGKKEAIRKAVNDINCKKPIANDAIKNEELEVDFFKFRSVVEKYFAEIISKVIKIPVEKIKPEVDFDKYGIDSLIIININDELEKVFGRLSSTLLFEYSNLRKLCAYFMTEYKEGLNQIIGEDMTSNPNIKEKQKVIIDNNKKIESNGRSKSSDCDIAIIGLSGKYPMADNLEEFWSNLKEGKDCIEEIPKERWDYHKYFNPDKNNAGTTYSKWGGFVKDVDKFDPLFFNISPKEAELMDPQERLFLETVWNCFESSGYHKNRLSGKEVGVFVGVMYGGYQLYGIDECNKGNMIALNSSFASIANRISYYFDLQGSSLSIDTMCSSSLTALHLACESIQRGDNQMALVGGVNLILHPNKYLLLSQGKFMSTDGRCRTFGADGDGYVPSEGVGTILLKPLSDAEKDGDYIYAVIKGTALNHGGKTNGYTVPNPNAQAKVIEKALHKTGIDPRTISYVEAHGTGTSLGDPIEITGLSKAYRNYTDRTQFCPIGSIKSNSGHMESAAGIAALTKVILQMTHKTLVPTIHSDVINPKINFKDSPFYIQHKLEQWNRPNVMVDGEYVECPRRAAISSFGAGGSNAHIILEEYYKENVELESKRSKEPTLILLSAKNEQRLKLYVKAIIDWLERKKDNKASEESYLSHIKTTLLRIISNLLGIKEDQIDTSDILQEFGVEQVVMNQFIEKINVFYGIEITSECCSKETSIAYIVNFLWDNYREQVMRLENYEQLLEKNCEYKLSDIAYTLMVGREAMEERIAFSVDSISELKQKLDAYYDGTFSDMGICQGNTKKSQLNNIIFDGRAGQQFLKIILEDKEISRIAELWVNGIEFEWNSLYEENYPNIIVLPTHPFINKRYWVGDYNQEETVQKMSNEDTPVKKAENTIVTTSQISSKWFDRINEKMTLWEQRSQSYHGDEVDLKIIDDSIAVVTLNDRENRNTFSDQLVMGLIGKFNEINQNQNIKAVVITGYENIFCMGGTQEQLIDISNQKSKFTDTPFMFLGLLQCNVPVISAIQGHASGGGLLFGLYGDIVVMAKEGIYSAVFTKYGFTPGMGATFILKEKFGNNLATEMMYTAKSFRGEELEERGASVVFRPNKEVLSTAINIAKLMADKPVHSLKVLKRELAGRITDQLLQCIYREEEMHAETFTQSVVKERINRYYRTNKTPESKEDTLSLMNNTEIRTVVNHDVKSNKITIESINEIITVIIKEILHLRDENFDVELGFKDLGVDSISGLEIVREINKEFKLELDSVIIYDYPTVKSLAEYIEGLLNKEDTIVLINEPKENTHVWGIKKKKLSLRQEKNYDEEALVQKNIPEQKTMSSENLMSETVIDGIKQITKEILHLHHAEFDTEMGFKDLGVDSISGLEIVREINKKYKLELDSVIIYDYPTIIGLAQHIEKLVGNEEFSSEETIHNMHGVWGISKKKTQSVQVIQDKESVLKKETVANQALDNFSIVNTVPMANKNNKEIKVEPAKKKISLKLKEKESEVYIDDTDKYIENVEKKNNSSQEGIAVIGMSGRFPGARNLDEFWSNLSQGVCSIDKIPKERWDNDEYYDSDITVPNKTYCNCGGFLTDIDEFDPLFFNISPLEAEYMDPQQRIFLEESWKALENAGYSNKALSNLKCGVFVGATQGDYSKKMSEVQKSNTAEAFAGVASSILAARISYFLNLKGPSISIDTACSSSLVAVHQACQSILCGESDMALAGGVRIMLTPDLMLQTSKMQMLSKAGMCKPFDENADGTVLGEGVGVIVLKSLKQAIKDGDYIYGVLKSSGMNQDGKTNGITAPSAQSQKCLELEVYKKGNINPKDITFIETHGTGTKLGDPIEVKALTEAFREYTLDKQFCGIGSVKSNIGHTTMCSGVSSIIKMLLCLQHKKIVPTVNYNTPNTMINFKDSPFYVVDKLQDWVVAANKKRIGAVSAFGMSGTNCHIVIEEAPELDY